MAYPPASEFAGSVAARVIAAHALEVRAGAVEAERVLGIIVDGDHILRFSAAASVVVVGASRRLRAIGSIDASGIGGGRRRG